MNARMTASGPESPSRAASRRPGAVICMLAASVVAGCGRTELDPDWTSDPTVRRDAGPTRDGAGSRDSGISSDKPQAEASGDGSAPSDGIDAHADDLASDHVTGDGAGGAEVSPRDSVFNDGLPDRIESARESAACRVVFSDDFEEPGFLPKWDGFLESSPLRSPFSPLQGSYSMVARFEDRRPGLVKYVHPGLSAFKIGFRVDLSGMFSPGDPPRGATVLRARPENGPTDDGFLTVSLATGARSEAWSIVAAWWSGLVPGAKVEHRVIALAGPKPRIEIEHAPPVAGGGGRLWLWIDGRLEIETTDVITTTVLELLEIGSISSGSTGQIKFDSVAVEDCSGA